MIVSLLNTRHSKTSKSKTCNYLIHLISENFVKVNIDIDSLIYRDFFDIIFGCFSSPYVCFSP